MRNLGPRCIRVSRFTTASDCRFLRIRGDPGSRCVGIAGKNNWIVVRGYFYSFMHGIFNTDE